jgi:molybdate transport system ATP-binding protein
VLSGFFDSIGLYHYATQKQHETATDWIERMGIMQLAKRRFDRLSDGEKRLVLLARAMVKSPDLLILDEPCQGLDPSNRSVILDLINQIGEALPTQLLYVTHQSGEIIPCITHILKLEKQTESDPAVATVMVRTNKGFPPSEPIP